MRVRNGLFGVALALVVAFTMPMFVACGGENNEERLELFAGCLNAVKDVEGIDDSGEVLEMTNYVLQAIRKGDVELDKVYNFIANQAQKDSKATNYFKLSYKDDKYIVAISYSGPGGFESSSGEGTKVNMEKQYHEYEFSYQLGEIKTMNISLWREQTQYNWDATNKKPTGDPIGDPVITCGKKLYDSSKTGNKWSTPTIDDATKTKYANLYDSMSKATPAKTIDLTAA